MILLTMMMMMMRRLLSQTTLRNILGTKNLHEILSDRESISADMQVKDIVHGPQKQVLEEKRFSKNCDIFLCFEGAKHDISCIRSQNKCPQNFVSKT